MHTCKCREQLAIYQRPFLHPESLQTQLHDGASSLQFTPLIFYRVQVRGLEWTTYTLTLLQLEQTTDLSGRRGTAPPTKPGFSQGFFFSILSQIEFSFLAAVASGLLSWGHFISSTIIDLIAQILFKLN